MREKSLQVLSGPGAHYPETKLKENNGSKLGYCLVFYEYFSVFLRGILALGPCQMWNYNNANNDPFMVHIKIKNFDLEVMIHAHIR